MNSYVMKMLRRANHDENYYFRDGRTVPSNIFIQRIQNVLNPGQLQMSRASPTFPTFGFMRQDPTM